MEKDKQPAAVTEEMERERVSVLWFRNGLRFHDNNSLAVAAADPSTKLLPIFIFDGETPTTKHCKFNKMVFLLECLEDLDKQFKDEDGRLNMILGKPVEVFTKLTKFFDIVRVCFDQDCEAYWLERDNAVKNFCVSQRIKVIENVGATLWDPLKVIDANGGFPPLTYAQFCHVTKAMGPPSRPKKDTDLSEVEIVDLSLAENLVSEDLTLFPTTPTPEMLGIERDTVWKEKKIFNGGEAEALKYFGKRIEHEKNAFLQGTFMPNRKDPDIFNPPKSLSPDLRYGCLSVRKFYWAAMDAWEEVNGRECGTYTIVSQLIWREFFYCMSANNPFYGEMERNPICIDVPWYDIPDQLEAFKMGKTGYPFIDAGIRQMRQEGWIHHILRNALSMFLTRGDLWLNWEPGFKIFMECLIDGDWAVCSGNWMWVSSSAFEKSLNSSFCLDPSVYGWRVDPNGYYVKKYVPELANLPLEYIYSPWKAPKEVQEKAKCIIGVDYPAPLVDHKTASQRNCRSMEDLQKNLLSKCNMEPEHLKPSDAQEVKKFFGLDPREN